MLAELRREDRSGSVGAKVALAVSSPTLERRALVDAVLAANRDVEVMRQAWRAAAAAVRGAGAVDDPMLRYSVAPLSIGSDAPFGQRIELLQKLRFPGKRGAEAELALADARAMQGDAIATRLMVAELASQLFDDLFVNARTFEINEHHRTLLEQMRAAAEARIASGRGSLQDGLQVEVELGMLERDRLMLDSERISIVARINGLLHRDPAARLPPPPAQLDVPGAPPASATLETAAIAGRPQKVSAEARLAGARAEVRVAERDYYPDLELMASYDSTWDLPEHRWMVGIGIELPLQRAARSAAVEAARARVAGARAAVDRTVDEIRVDVTRSRGELVEAIAVVELYDKRLVPAARAQVDAALAGLAAGQNDFPAVLQAERGLRELELGAFRARAEAWRREASLDRAIGRIAGGGS